MAAAAAAVAAAGAFRKDDARRRCEADNHERGSKRGALHGSLHGVLYTFCESASPELTLRAPGGVALRYTREIVKIPCGVVEHLNELCDLGSAFESVSASSASSRRSGQRETAETIQTPRSPSTRRFCNSDAEGVLAHAAN